MALDPRNLLPGESVLASKAANAVVQVRAAGLGRYRFDGLMWAVGMRGKESIGGRLHLTEYRLVFESHAVNRLTGRFSVFLPLVTKAENASAGVKRQLRVTTGTQSFLFVVWGVPRLVSHLHDAAAGFTPRHVAWLAGAVAREPHVVGEGLRPASAAHGGADVVRQVARAGPGGAASFLAGVDPRTVDGLGLAGALQLAELLDRSRQV